MIKYIEVFGKLVSQENNLHFPKAVFPGDGWPYCEKGLLKGMAAPVAGQDGTDWQGQAAAETAAAAAEYGKWLEVGMCVEEGASPPDPPVE